MHGQHMGEVAAIDAWIEHGDRLLLPPQFEIALVTHHDDVSLPCPRDDL